MRLDGRGAVTGWASLRLAGGRFFDGRSPDGETLPVELVCPDRQLRSRGPVIATRQALDSGEVVSRQSVPCTGIERAVLDEIRRRPELGAAVTTIDMAVAAELTSLRRLGTRLQAHAGAPGIRAARRALAMASEHSRSPQETAMRLVWEVQLGLPRPLCNQPVFGRDGRLLGIPDLLDVDAGVVGEYDGADHLTRSRRSRDLARLEGFREAGLECFTLVAGDLQPNGPAAARMMSTRRRAAHLPEAQRRWTITPPPWWHRDGQPSLSLEAKLEARELMVAWHERHQHDRI